MITNDIDIIKQIQSNIDINQTLKLCVIDSGIKKHKTEWDNSEWDIYKSTHEKIKKLNPFFFANQWYLKIENREDLDDAKIIYKVEKYPYKTFQDFKIFNLVIENSELEIEISELKEQLDCSHFDHNKIVEPELSKILEKDIEGKKLLKKIGIYQSNLNKINAYYSLKSLNNSTNTVKPLLTIKDYLPIHNELLKQYRGKQYVGLCQKTIPELDDNLLGLRDLIILAAPPNVGKTALTIQLGIDVVINNPDCCLLYVTREMPKEDIYARIKCYLTPINWKDLYLGNLPFPSEDCFFNEKTNEALKKSDEKIKEIGDRVLILDSEDEPILTIEKVIFYVNELKLKNNCKKIIIIIDYLQVWSIPEHINQTLRGELDCDKWRAEQMKLLRDKLDGNPLLVISEARKPNTASIKWGHDLSDIMGSGRNAYSPDAVLHLNPLTPDELKEQIQKILKYEINEEAEDIYKYFNNKDESICYLKISKGRDGMTKGNIIIRYHFKRNYFESFKWTDIKEDLEENFSQKKEKPKEENKSQNKLKIKPAKQIIKDDESLEVLPF